MSHADGLANDFRKAYEQTLPAIDALEYILPDGANAEAHIEACMQVLRNGLTSMEQCTTNMMNMLYEVDVYMAPSTVQNAAGFNPQEAVYTLALTACIELSVRVAIKARGTC